MDRTPTANPHTFHIPVMGTGFTIDTPLKVARFGIASAVSLVDDVFIEKMRRKVAEDHGEPFLPIEDREPDARARRITAYLDLLDTVVNRQVERLRATAFEPGSEIVRYFELLAPSPLRDLYQRMLATEDAEVQGRLQEELRAAITPGAIDVNIMTKLDRDHDRGGRKLPVHGSDALSAIRGFMNSRVNGSVVLSAGMNRRLFTYMAEFPGLFPDENGDLRKRVVLKVSDYRSGMLQGKLLAKLGLHISEFRFESGLNCGGHAFGGKGELLGPLLAEFKRERPGLIRKLARIRRAALAERGLAETSGEPAPSRVTVQGGIGEAHEDRFLREHYGVDGTGWGSAFLFVPEVVNIDHESLAQLEAAGEDDIHLSAASPLGVPFWSMKTSSSEQKRRERIAAGKPGSLCPKGYLVSNAEFSKAPICTASRQFQRRKLEQIGGAGLAPSDAKQAEKSVVTKACICHDLAGVATLSLGIDPTATPAVCCGPNAAYFDRATTLDALVDHIYGRASVPVDPARPHMLLKELTLHLDCLRRDMTSQASAPTEREVRALAECRENLRQGVDYYHSLVGEVPASKREAFASLLESLDRELAVLTPAPVSPTTLGVTS